MTGIHPVERDDDGETVGRVRPADDGLWVPETVFGGILGDARTHDDAIDLVLSTGMASLIEAWWLEVDGGWQRVELVEIRPDQVRVREWTPFNLAVGGDADAGYWVDPAERPLFRHEPRP